MLFSQSLAAFIVSWNRDLTHEELLKVSSYLIDGSTAPKESLQIKVTTDTNTAPTNAGNTPTYFSWKLAPVNLKEMPCSDLGGADLVRYVRISSGSDWLNLNEVQVFGTGSMIPITGSRSSSNYNSQYTPEKCYDGITNSLGCHSGTATNWWISFDLGGLKRVDSIKIYNRNNCCQNRINNAIVSVRHTEDGINLWEKKIISQTAIMDFNVDSAGSCSSTSNMAAEDTCSKNGLQIVIPRSEKHFDTMINRFGKDPFRQAMAGVYKPRNFESYTFVAMNSGVMPENGYKALDGGEWWIRDTKYGEPSGDYTKGHWLGTQNVEHHPFTFNDGNHHYKTNSYICSDNNPDHTRIYLNPPTGTIAVPSAQQSLAGSVIFATSSERISQEVAPTSILYSVSIKACNAANECSDAFTMPTITSDKFESSERTCNPAKKCDWSCPVISNDHSSGLSGQFFNIKKSCSGLTKSESILSIQQTRTIVSELAYKGVPPAEKWTTNGAHDHCNDPKYYGIGSPTGSLDRSVCLTQLNNGWLQLDLGAVKTVVAVVTTGCVLRVDSTFKFQYVTKYTITVSNNGSTFTNAPCVQKDSNGYCNGNTDHSKENTNILAGSITARFVRLNVKAYNGYASLRMGVYVKI